MNTLERKLKDIMDDDLTKSNRYLLAAVFNHKPGNRDDINGGKAEVDSPVKKRKNKKL